MTDLLIAPARESGGEDLEALAEVVQTAAEQQRSPVDDVLDSGAVAEEPSSDIKVVGGPVVKFDPVRAGAGVGEGWPPPNIPNRPLPFQTGFGPGARADMGLSGVIADAFRAWVIWLCLSGLVRFDL